MIFLGWKHKMQKNTIHFENNYSESDGGLKGQNALSPGQRPGVLIQIPLFHPEEAKAL